MQSKLLAAGIALQLLALTAKSRADEIETCLSASENGQRARQKSALTEARDFFKICTRSVCPALVQQNCARFSADVAAIMPTLTLVARDTEGRDIVNVSVFLDGKVVAERLDGRAIAVNPGVHQLRFEAPSGAVTEERIVVTEGEKARKVSVVLQAIETGAPEVPAASKKPNVVIPIIILSAGAAIATTGLIVRLSGTSAYPEGCTRGDPGVCAPSTGIADAGLREAERQDRTSAAENAENREIFGLWTLVAGGAAFATGLTWLLVRMASSSTHEPTTKVPAASSVTPILGFGVVGLRGSF